MNQSKIILYSLLGVAVGAVIAVSIYSIKYFSAQTRETENRSQEIKNKLANSEPKIVVPADNCDLPAGYVKNRFYLDFSSIDVDKSKKSVDDLIIGAGGDILSVSDGRYPVNDPSIIQRQVGFFISLPQDKFKSFVAEMKKIAASPNFSENESINQETEYNVETYCRNSLRAIKQLRQQEATYLDQLQSSDISFGNKQEIINALTSLRQQAEDNVENIKTWTQKSDRSEINITIREIVG